MANGNGDDERWQRELRNLQRLMAQYTGARSRGDEALSNTLAHRIVEAMQRLAQTHPDPRVREHWREKAIEFAAADETDREHILADIGKGLLILLATPFALAGGVLFAAGAIVYGVGTFVKGLGNLATGGVFRK
jgi:hypothetical protein